MGIEINKIEKKSPVNFTDYFIATEESTGKTISIQLASLFGQKIDFSNLGQCLEYNDVVATDCETGEEITVGVNIESIVFDQESFICDLIARVEELETLFTGFKARITVIQNNFCINCSPFVDAGNFQLLTLPVNQTTLNATATDPDGNVTLYSWDKIYGGAATIASPNSQNTQITGLESGYYIFRVTVGDDSGLQGFNTVGIKVNDPPTVVASADQTIVAPLTTAYISSNATDTDGTITSYLWEKISGGTVNITDSTSSATQITGLSSGTYTFRITVTDDCGATATDTTVVKVISPPIADAGDNSTVTFPQNSQTLDGSGSSDADGTIVSYLWEKISGGAGNIVNPNVAVTTVTGIEQGDYLFKLTVTDNDGLTDEDFVQITVEGFAVPCGQALQASGNVGIYILDIVVTTDTGMTGIQYESFSVPDRFILEYDGQVVADSKYVGDGLTGNPPSYTGLLGTHSNLPVNEYQGTGFVPNGATQTINVSQSDIANGTTEPTDGGGTLLFNKTTAFPTIVRLTVFAPVGGTAWNITGICPSNA